MTAPINIAAKTKLDLGNKIRLDTTLTANSRLIGVFIADHVNTQRGFAWCTQKQIAIAVGVSTRTVRRAIKGLEKYFAIDRSGRANEYRIGDKMSSVAPGNRGHFRPRKGTKTTKIEDTSVPPSSNILRDPLSSDKLESGEAGNKQARKQATGHKPKSLTQAVYGTTIDEAEAETYLAAFESLPPEERLTLLKSPMENKKLKQLAHHAGKAESRKRAQELLGQIATEERR